MDAGAPSLSALKSDSIMELQGFLNSSEQVATFILADPSCQRSVSFPMLQKTSIKRKAFEMSPISEEELHKVLTDHIARKRANNASASRLLRLLPELKTYIMTFVSRSFSWLLLVTKHHAGCLLIMVAPIMP